MNGYTCIKALVLGGVGYTAGSNIPAEAVLPGRVRALIKQGYISPATDEPAPVPAPEGHTEAIAELQEQIARLHAEAEAVQAELQQVISERDELKGRLESPEEHTDPVKLIIPLARDGGVLDVPAAPESVVTFVQNLQLTAEESTKAIETMTDDTALILIHALDGRKTVKAAAQARAAALETSNEAVPGSEEGQGQGDT
ncbi:hypothetical protein [uncultured Oscillibacter sp.]|jgi:hypothetical protein|uniref:hypothetical protein n=1 Tax=uncultured Oscillibacter sp. TaxID=876091 RepID=UPI00272B8878|nr:hypothetical protein [uncultured Oscillibacter sp.]